MYPRLGTSALAASIESVSLHWLQAERGARLEEIGQIGLKPALS